MSRFESRARRPSPFSARRYSTEEAARDRMIHQNMEEKRKREAKNIPPMDDMPKGIEAIPAPQTTRIVRAERRVRDRDHARATHAVSTDTPRKRAIELKYEVLSRRDQEARVNPQDADEQFGGDVARFDQAVSALSDAVPTQELHGAIRGISELQDELRGLPPHLRKLRPWSMQDLDLILHALRAREL